MRDFLFFPLVFFFFFGIMFIIRVGVEFNKLRHHLDNMIGKMNYVLQNGGVTNIDLFHQSRIKKSISILKLSEYLEKKIDRMLEYQRANKAKAM